MRTISYRLKSTLFRGEDWLSRPASGNSIYSETHLNEWLFLSLVRVNTSTGFQTGSIRFYGRSLIVHAGKLRLGRSVIRFVPDEFLLPMVIGWRSQAPARIRPPGVRPARRSRQSSRMVAPSRKRSGETREWSRKVRDLPDRSTPVTKQPLSLGGWDPRSRILRQTGLQADLRDFCAEIYQRDFFPAAIVFFRIVKICDLSLSFFPLPRFLLSLLFTVFFFHFAICKRN